MLRLAGSRRHLGVHLPQCVHHRHHLDVHLVHLAAARHQHLVEVSLDAVPLGVEYHPTVLLVEYSCPECSHTGYFRGEGRLGAACPAWTQRGYFRGEAHPDVESPIHRQLPARQRGSEPLPLAALELPEPALPAQESLRLVPLPEELSVPGREWVLP